MWAVDVRVVKEDLQGVEVCWMSGWQHQIVAVCQGGGLLDVGVAAPDCCSLSGCRRLGIVLEARVLRYL